jgi:hypothetical protein
MSMSADRFARLEVKENPIELAPKQVTVAFGRQGVDKLVKCLGNEDVDIIVHSLEILDDSLLKIQKNVVLFLQVDGVEATNSLTLMPEETVAVLAIKCLTHVAAVNAGCARMLETKTVANLTQLLASEEASVAVKLAAYALLHKLSSRVDCVKQLLKEFLLDFLLQQIEAEQDPRLKTAAMDVVANCGHLPSNPREPHKLVRGGGVAAVLGAGGASTVGVCVKLLGHESPPVQASAARILQVCSLTEEGRDVVVEAGAVKVLVELVTAKSVAVRKAATAALLSLTISEAGKKQFHRLLGCAGLVDRLQHEPAPDVTQNVIKIVSSMCCYPAARKELKDDGAAEILQGIAEYHAAGGSQETRELALLA